MKNFYRRSRLRLLLACLLIGGGLPSCSDSEEGRQPGLPARPAHRPRIVHPDDRLDSHPGHHQGQELRHRSQGAERLLQRKNVPPSSPQRASACSSWRPSSRARSASSRSRWARTRENKTQFDEIFNYIIQTNVSTVAGGTKGHHHAHGNHAALLRGQLHGQTRLADRHRQGRQHLCALQPLFGGERPPRLHDERGGRKHQAPQRLRHPRNGYHPLARLQVGQRLLVAHQHGQ